MAAQGFTEKEYMTLQGIYTGKYNTLINIPLAMANGLAASVIPSLTMLLPQKNKKEIHGKDRADDQIDDADRDPLFYRIYCAGKTVDDPFI